MASADLRRQAADLPVSWVATDNFHITVKFLGRIDDARVPVIAEALHAAIASHHAFDLEVASLGAFPSASRPRVLWAGVTEGGAALAALAAAVDDALGPLGFPREERAFTAHVTLARVRESRRTPVRSRERPSALVGALAAAAGRRFGRRRVEHVALVRSDLSPRGARYTEITRVPLLA